MRGFRTRSIGRAWTAPAGQIRAAPAAAARPPRQVTAEFAEFRSRFGSVGAQSARLPIRKLKAFCLGCAARLTQCKAAQRPPGLPSPTSTRPAALTPKVLARRKANRRNMFIAMCVELPGRRRAVRPVRACGHHDLRDAHPVRNLRRDQHARLSGAVGDRLQRPLLRPLSDAGAGLLSHRASCWAASISRPRSASPSAHLLHRLRASPPCA